MGPTRHYRLSPSSSARWLACPFSAQNNLPQSAHPTAAIGHKWHAAASEVLLGNLPLDSIDDNKARDGIEMYVEHVCGNDGENFVEYQWVSPSIDEFGGTTDCLVLKDNKCAVYDFKTGKWPVEAEGNTQLLCYLSIVAEHHPELDEFYGVIVQPWSKEREKIKVAEFCALEVDDFRGRVEDAATATHKGTGDHCRFCPLRPTCVIGQVYAWERGWR